MNDKNNKNSEKITGDDEKGVEYLLKVAPDENSQIYFKQRIIKCIYRYLENLNQYRYVRKALESLKERTINHINNNRKPERELGLFKIIFRFPSDINGTKIKLNIDLRFIENLNTFINSEICRLKNKVKTDIEDRDFKRIMTYFPEESDDGN